MRSKLIVFSGLMGSGKSSTIAREFTRPSEHVISYDEIRNNNQNLQPFEIVQCMLVAAVDTMRNLWYVDVIIDACNLHPHDRIRWETMAMAFGREFVWRSMATSVTECVMRDAQRPTPVGALAIHKQFVEAYDWNRAEGKHASQLSV